MNLKASTLIPPFSSSNRLNFSSYYHLSQRGGGHFKGYLACHDSLLWLQYAVLCGDLGHRNLWHLLSKSSKQVHKIIISKDFIWLSYNIHFVSAIIIIIIFPLIMQQWIWKLQHPLPSPLTTGFWSSSKPKGGGGGRLNIAWLTLGNLNQKCWDFPLECTYYISLNVEVFKVVSALSLTNGSEEKKVHRV